jgi:hypothetical protein
MGRAKAKPIKAAGDEEMGFAALYPSYEPNESEGAGGAAHSPRALE